MSEQNGTALEIMTYESHIASRAALSSLLGKAFGGDRDYYETLGYKLNPTIEDYYTRYKRQDIAARIVEAYPNETWRLHPRIYEDDTEADTPFEAAWTELDRRLRIFHYFRRADILACLGHFSLIFLGLNDVSTVEQLENPVVRGEGRDIIYLSVFSELHAKISKLDDNVNSPRYGLPLLYEIDFSRRNKDTRVSSRSPMDTAPKLVHWERVIHIAQDTLEDEVYGTPKLEGVFNNLDNLIKISGGSAESFWMNAKKDLIAEVAADARLTETEIAALQERMEKYIHNYQRVLGVQGTEIKTLTTQIASPRDAFDVEMELISSRTGIPQRMLQGSERGELACSQDSVSWAEKNMTRQSDYAEPVIVRQFVDRTIMFRVLPTPRSGVDGYTVEWQPLITESEPEKADRRLKTVQAMSQYADSNAPWIWPPQEVRELVFEMDPESPYEMPAVTDARESQNDDDLTEEDEDVDADAEP